MIGKSTLTLGAALSLVLLASGGLDAAEGEDATGLLRVLTGMEPESIAVPLRFFVIVTVLSVVPSVILLATCFPRILIVLSFLRRAIGTQDLPSNQILAGLTLMLTILIMLPVFKRVHDEAYLPLKRGEMESTEAALAKAGGAFKDFMLSHTLEKDLQLFRDLYADPGGGGEDDGLPGREPTRSETSPGDLSFFVVLPAFVLSELKVAFQMGFLLYLPFLVIDLAVSAVLISMGMFMLPPALVSLPLKVLVFVLADGWNLVVEQIVEGFRIVM